MVFVLLQAIERRLGIGLGFFSMAYSLLATVGLTRLILSVVDHDRTAAQHREHGRDAGGEHGLLGRGDLGLLPLAHAPGQDGSSGYDGPDERGQKGLRRGAHA